MSYPLASHSCVQLQVCPVVTPGQAPQTPMWMAIWPCLHGANRGGGIVGMPQTLAPLNQDEMRAKAAPDLRARQQEGSLPGSCRGAACTADEFITSVTARFQVLKRGMDGAQKLKGQHVLILLAERDAQAVGSTDWMLGQHGDFSDRNGRVIMNDEARKWLTHSRGATQLKPSDQQFHRHWAALLEDLKGDIEEFVKDQKLGAAPVWENAGIEQLQKQFATWLTNAKSSKVIGKLNGYGQKLREIIEMVADYAPATLATKLAKADGLTVSVLAGADARLDAQQIAGFKGMILSPAAQWSVKALTASLHQRAIEIKLVDLKRKQLPDDQLLNRKLLVAGIESNDATEASVLASRLVAGLIESPDGKVPVTVLALNMDGVAVHSAGQQTRLLDDPLLEKTYRATIALEKTAEALLTLMTNEGNSSQEPLTLEMTSVLGHHLFASLARERVEGFASQRARQAGLKLLNDYEAGFQDVSRLQVQRWRTVMSNAGKAVQQSASDKGMHVLLLRLDIGRAVLNLLRDTPEQDQLAPMTVVTSVTPMNTAVPLVPDIKLM